MTIERARRFIMDNSHSLLDLRRSPSRWEFWRRCWAEINGVIEKNYYAHLMEMRRLREAARRGDLREEELRVGREQPEKMAA